MKLFNSLSIRGKVGAFIYSRVRKGCGNIPGDRTNSLQKRIWKPINLKNTPKQAASRLKFKQGMQAWVALPPNMKWAYRLKGNRHAITAINQFMKEYMKK